MTTTWNCKEPQLEKRRGQRGPDDDYIGPKSQLNPNQRVFEYLTNFGLKWNNLEQDLQTAEAYWPGHADNQDIPIPALFRDIENPWPSFLEMIDRHGTGNPVKMEIVRHETYGLGPKRTGQFPIVKMIPIEREGGIDVSAEEFKKEAILFGELWDNLTKVVFAKDDARFMVGGKFTEDGRALAVAVLVPLVHTYPDAVKLKKPDGSPRIDLPPEPNGWTLNGLVCANLTAERLMKLDEEERFNVVDLKEADNLLTWAAEAVPEWEGAGDDGEGGETL